MSDKYERLILERVKMGPKTMAEIIEGTDMNEKTANNRARSLVHEGILRDAVIEVVTKRGKRLVHLYYLPQDEELVKSGQWDPLYLRYNPILHSRVKEAIVSLMQRKLLYPTLEEIAREVGVNPESKELKNMVYEVAKEVGWRPPTDEELALAKSVNYDRIKLLVKYIDMGVEKPWLKFCTEDDIKEAKNRYGGVIIKI